MEVQHSDAVISNGRLYRVQAKPDGMIYKSVTRPAYESGNKIIDGINWGVVQDKITYTAGVRNVVFRDIFLEKPRVGFSVHFDHDKWSRSYYPGAEIPKQENLLFDNINVLYDEKMDWLAIATPVDMLSVVNCNIRDNRISFRGDAMPDYQKTIINITNTVFNKEGEMEFLTNNIKTGKKIILKTSSNIEMHDDFSAKVTPGNGEIIIDSDLSGLRNGREK